MTDEKSSIDHKEQAVNELLNASNLPGVRVTNRPLRDMVDSTLKILEDANNKVTADNVSDQIFVNIGMLCRIVLKGEDKEKVPTIEFINETHLKGRLTRVANFIKITPTGTPHHVSPPVEIVADILAMGAWNFPELEAIVEFPIIRADGSLLDIPGYDSSTRLYYLPSSDLNIPTIPVFPNEEDVRWALELINECIGEFPFQDEASYANTIGLLLTPLIRHAIRGQVPLALLDATSPGTGKSLLSEIVSMVATGRMAAMMTAPFEEDEWRKKIFSTLLGGSTIVVIDNIKYAISSTALESALTCGFVTDRILGLSKNVTIKQRATWMASGNNIQIVGDMKRRCYTIRLDAKIAKPWTRDGFKIDLSDWLPEHRGEMIAALLTLARSWYANGGKQVQVHTLGNFEKWAKTVGSILSNAGVKGFLDNLDGLQEQASEGDYEWAAFLLALHEFSEGREFLAKAVVSQVLEEEKERCGLLYDALPSEISNTHKWSGSRNVGNAIAKYENKRFNETDIHLERGGTDKRSGAVKWKVVGVQVSPDETCDPSSQSTGHSIASSQVMQVSLPSNRVKNSYSYSSPSSIGKNRDAATVSKPAKPANLQNSETKIGPLDNRWETTEGHPF